MANTYLISPARLKAASEIHENVDDKICKRAIRSAQDIQLEQVLGTTLIEKIKALVSSGLTAPENEKYKTLLDEYIEDALIYFALEEILDLSSFKIMNKGVMTREAEEAQPIRTGEREALKRRYRSKAEHYCDRLTRYLIANAEDFPEYASPDSGIDKIKPKKSGWNMGFYFPE